MPELITRVANLIVVVLWVIFIKCFVSKITIENMEAFLNAFWKQIFAFLGIIWLFAWLCWFFLSTALLYSASVCCGFPESDLWAFNLLGSPEDYWFQLNLVHRRVRNIWGIGVKGRGRDRCISSLLPSCLVPSFWQPLSTTPDICFLHPNFC